MKRSTLSYSFLNITLLFVESILTLLLRLDPELRKAAYPLAKKGTLVCLRVYLPHTQIYATFSNKGVLLDAQLPNGRHEPDVIINAYSLNIFGAIATQDASQVNKLQMRGETTQVELVKSFLLQLGVDSLIQGLLQKIKGKAQHKEDKSDKDKEKQKQEEYKQRISEQQEQINTLTMKNRELETALKGVQSKQKTLTISLVVVSVIALVCIISLFSMY